MVFHPAKDRSMIAPYFLYAAMAGAAAFTAAMLFVSVEDALKHRQG